MIKEHSKGQIVLNVLVAASSESGFENIKALLPIMQFDPVVHAVTATDARLKSSSVSPDIVIIVCPLKDESGVQLAIDIASCGKAEVLLLTGKEIYSQASFIAEKYGIITLSTPCNKQILLQTLTVLGTEKIKMKALEKQNARLQIKIDEIRMVDRAKLLLVEKLGMTETEAHRYIEKTAMDRCVKRSVIAENIIKTYES
jgi:AmiR/NasT family two-component response regulator